MKKFLVTMFAALMLVASPALAAQTQEGTMLLMNPVPGCLGACAGLSSGITGDLYANTGIIMEVDGAIFALEEGLAEYSLVGDAGVVGTCDIDIYFYDVNGGIVGSGTSEFCEEGGEIPAGAALAAVHLWLGFNVGYTYEAE